MYGLTATSPARRPAVILLILSQEDVLLNGNHLMRKIFGSPNARLGTKLWNLLECGVLLGEGSEVLLHVDHKQLQLLPRRNGGGAEEFNLLVWSK